MARSEGPEVEVDSALKRRLERLGLAGREDSWADRARAWVETQRPLQQLAMVILLLTAAMDVQAKIFAYRGDLQISAMSGASCPSDHSLALPVSIYIRDDAKPERYEGYVVAASAATRIAGRRLDDLKGTAPDLGPELQARVGVSLGSLGADPLTGEAHAESVSAQTPGCFLDQATFKLARLTEPHESASFKLARDKFAVSSQLAQWQVLSAKKDHAGALSLARQTVALAERSYAPNDGHVRAALFAQFNTLVALDKLGDAEPLIRRIIAIDEQVQRSKGPLLAGSLASLGVILRINHRYDEAETVLRRAFALDGVTKDQRGVIALQLWQIQSANAAEKYRIIEIAEREEVAKEEAANDAPKLAYALVQLGDLLEKTGRYAEAEPLLRRSLAIGEKVVGTEDPRLAYIYGELGMLLNNTGHFSESQQLLRRAVSLAEHSDNDADLPTQLQNLSRGLECVGRLAEAEALARRALDLTEHAKQPKEADIGSAEGRLASVLASDHRYADAEPYQRHVVAVTQQYVGPEDPRLGWVLGRLANTLVEEQKYQEAAPLLLQSIKISENSLGRESVLLISELVDLATILRESGRYTEAQATLERAFRLARSLNVAIDWLTAGSLMRYYRDPQVAQPAIAIYYGKQAVNKTQGLRAKLGDSESDQSFVEKMAPIYRELADLLMQQGRLNEEQQVLAMLKEQELFDFTEGGSAAGKSAIEFNDAESKLAAQDDALIGLEKESMPLQAKLRADGQLGAADQASLDEVRAKIQIEERNFQTQAVVVENTSDKELDKLAGQYVALGKEYGALQENARKSDGKLTAPDLARKQQLRAAMDAAQATFDARASSVANSAGDPEAQKRRMQEINHFSRGFEGTLKGMGHDAVMAQYFILDDKVSILLTTPNAMVARETIIQRAQLNALILSFRKTLSNPALDPAPQAQTLYNVLIEPIAADLHQAGAKTLMLDLDDTLRYLPFAALYDGKNYLIENMAVVMVTEAVRDKLASQPKPEEWKVYGLGLTKAGPGYDALPYAAVELNGIAGKRGVLSGTVLLDQAFTESSLRDGLEQSYPIVHIASHFRFTPGSMDDSFLLLGDGSHMTLAQIRTKLNFNNVELLTLSACETALGDSSVAHHGVEVEGLGALAQEAGAKSVLATLWPVADESTAALMRALYEKHKVERLDKAEALRQAQLALLHGTVQADAGATERRGLARKAETVAVSFKTDPKAPFAHPFYWAPFILMGNWL
jgi:CHAT domain-containing protein